MNITEFINNVAEDCIQNMSEKEKQILIDNPNEIDYHFTLGLYIRNKYIYKEKALLEETVLEPDNISSSVIDEILSKLLPEYQYENSYIKMLYGNNKFIELRRAYKEIYGNYPVEIVKMYETSMEKIDKREIFKTINTLAELVFRQKEFREKVEELGIVYNDISKYVKELKRIFYEEEVYIPLEVCLMLFKNKIEKSQYVTYRKILTQKILKNSSIIEYLNKDYFKDRVLARSALKKGWTLEYLPMYQDDEKMVKYSLKQNGVAIEFASKRFQENREWVKFAIENTGVIMHLDCMEPYRKDKELVYLACKNSSTNLYDVDEIFRDDLELAKMCMKQKKEHDHIMYCLSDRLKNNKELIMLDLEKNYPSFEDYSDRLKDDDDVARRLYELHGSESRGWYHMSKRVRDKYNIWWDEQ